VWDWRGNLLVREASVARARGVIDRWFDNAPRVSVEAEARRGSPSGARMLRELLRARLSTEDKLLMLLAPK